MRRLTACETDDNESASPADKADQEVVKQGKIVVRLQRGKAGTSKRKAYSPPAAEHLCVPAKSTKRAVVDSGRSHYAKSVSRPIRMCLIDFDEILGRLR